MLKKRYNVINSLRRKVIKFYKEMQVQDLPIQVKGYLTLFLNPQSFVRLASTCRGFRQACSQAQYYNRVRVKHMTTFEPIPEEPLLADYEKVFETIHKLCHYEGRYYQLSESLNRLILQTPFILNQIIFSKGGLEEILLIIDNYHSLHPLVFQNAVLIEQFKESSDHWLTPFINIISDNKELFYSFLSSDLMIDAVAYCQSIPPQTKRYLCRRLKEEYDAKEECLIPVQVLTYTDMRDAIVRLLKSLRPSADDECIDNHDLELLYGSPQSSKQRMKQKQREDAVVDLERMLTTETKTTSYQSLFHLAVGNEETERVRFFAQSKYVEIPNRDGDYPIHIATILGYSKLVKILASNSRHRDRTDSEGETALHVACITEKLDIVTILLEAGADFLAVNREGSTPKSILIDRHHDDFVESYEANKENRCEM